MPLQHGAVKRPLKSVGLPAQSLATPARIPCHHRHQWLFQLALANLLWMGTKVLKKHSPASDSAFACWQVTQKLSSQHQDLFQIHAGLNLPLSSSQVLKLFGLNLGPDQLWTMCQNNNAQNSNITEQSHETWTLFNPILKYIMSKPLVGHYCSTQLPS